MKDMVDDEGEDGESRPDHDEGGLGSLHGRLVGVGGAGGLVFFGQEDGENDVKGETGEQANSSDPDTHAMKESVEEMGIIVEGVSAGEDK